MGSWGEAALHSGKRTCILILISFYLLTWVGRTLDKLLNLPWLLKCRMGQGCFKDSSASYAVGVQ